MMDTRLRNLLHDIASEMPVEVETTGPPTLRKARRRRAVGAAGAVVAVVAFVAVGLSALRLASEPTQPAATGPRPETDAFPALWPETDPGALAETQTAADNGSMPLRTTPDGTASLLATNLLGWAPRDVRIEREAGDADAATVVISNRIFGDGVPPITVELRRLADRGPNGVWSVVNVASPLVEIDEAAGGASGVVDVSGTVTDLYDSAPAITLDVFDGPTLVPPVGSARDELVDETFRFSEVTLSPTPDGEATMLLSMPDATGASLGAVMTSIETPVGEIEVQGPNVTGMPVDVAVTAQLIYDAAQAGDLEGLADLIDPNTFVYNLDDGSDPTPAWRENPSELDVMAAILEMPPTSREIGPGYGTFYFWPYLVNSNFEDLTPQERADLAALGYSDEDIALIADGGTGYQGPRLAIDENGEWRNFITVGE
jgi:hypothetical protein